MSNPDYGDSSPRRQRFSLHERSPMQSPSTAGNARPGDTGAGGGGRADRSASKTESGRKAKTVRLTGKAFAELLGVSAAALSQSVKNEHYCGGYPAHWWAKKSPGGRVSGYDVPARLVETLRSGAPKINAFDLPAPGSPETDGSPETGGSPEAAAPAPQPEEQAPRPKQAPRPRQAPQQGQEQQQQQLQQEPLRENPPRAAAPPKNAGAPFEEPAEVVHALLRGTCPPEEARAAFRRLLAAEEAPSAASASRPVAEAGGPSNDESAPQQEPASQEEPVPQGEWAGYQGTSLLPPDQDYAPTAAAVGTAVVLRDAIAQDNDIARGLALFASAGIGALLGSELAGKERRGAGGAAGGVLAAALSAWGMGLLGSPEAKGTREPAGDRRPPESVGFSESVDAPEAGPAALPPARADVLAGEPEAASSHVAAAPQERESRRSSARLSHRRRRSGRL